MIVKMQIPKPIEFDGFRMVEQIEFQSKGAES